MDILILSIFAIVVVLSFLEDYMPSWQKLLILFTLGIAMICISTFKPMTTTDAKSYEYYFYNNDDIIIETATEPTYIQLSRLVLSFGGGVIVMFFIYAALAVPLKLTAFWKITPYVFTALLAYVGIYYPRQDVVAIRCGVAAAFLLWALVPLAKRKYFLATVLTFVATMFHYSSLAFLPILFVGNMQVGKFWKYLLGAAIPICLALYMVGISAVSLIPAAIIEGKLDIYKEMSESGGWEEYIPYKQLTFLTEFVLLYIFIFYYETIKKHCIYAPILIKILVMKMGILIMFAKIPVLGGRLDDLFGIFTAISLTCCMYCIKPQYVVRIGICVFSLSYYIIYMLSHSYFN